MVLYRYIVVAQAKGYTSDKPLTRADTTDLSD